MAEPTTEAGRALEADIRELAEAFHQVGSLRDHADPNDRTGWNVHGIETCEDVYCLDALAAGAAILAIEAEARESERARIRAGVEALTRSDDPDFDDIISRTDVLALLDPAS